MGSKTGQSLAALDMKLPLSISTLRDKLKIECKKPRNAVPCNPQSGQPCLFDIDADPCEYNNLADEMPRKVKDLLAIIEEYRAVAVPPINLDKSLLNYHLILPKKQNALKESFKSVFKKIGININVDFDHENIRDQNKHF